MQTFNLIMMFSVWTLMLWIWFDGKHRIKSYLQQRKTKQQEQIKNIVIEYLKELQND